MTHVNLFTWNNNSFQSVRCSALKLALKRKQEIFNYVLKWRHKAIIFRTVGVSMITQQKEKQKSKIATTKKKQQQQRKPNKRDVSLNMSLTLIKKNIVLKMEWIRNILKLPKRQNKNVKKLRRIHISFNATFGVNFTHCPATRSVQFLLRFYINTIEII